jgi:hypothetical protein
MHDMGGFPRLCFRPPANTLENSRAWTFQEGQFSRRMLMFCDQTVIWKCLCSCTDEVGTNLAADSPEGSSLAHLNLLLRGKANLGEPFGTLVDEYCRTIVSPYNTRNCTRTADFPRAFEGIAHALTETAAPGTLFFQGLCWGLPVAYLPHALTWCAAEENLRPREQFLGPSWSWMSWEGNITPERVLHGPWDISDFQLVPMSGCDWDLVYPKWTSRQNSARDPGDAQRPVMSIKGEFCRFIAGQLQWTYHTADESGQIGYCSAVYEHDPTKSDSIRLIALFPDQVNEVFPLADIDLYLVGISTYRGREWDPEVDRKYAADRKGLVKAIWVARTDEGLILDDKPVPSFRRLGVALVNSVDWGRGLTQGVSFAKVLLE